MVTFKANHPRSLLSKIGFFRAFLPICFVLTILLLAIVHQKLLRVVSVSCQAGQEDCPQAVESLISTSIGQSLLRLNLVQIKKEILGTGLVDSAEIKIKSPGQLIFIIAPPSSSYFLSCLFTSPQPSFSYDQATSAADIVPPSTDLAAFVATNSGRTFQLLSTGILTQADSDTSYHLILGSIPQKEYLSVVFSWLKALGDAGMKPSALYFLTDQLVIKLTDQPDLLMGINDDPYQKLLALQRLNQAITIKKPKVIDFRYTHPILK